MELTKKQVDDVKQYLIGIVDESSKIKGQHKEQADNIAAFAQSVLHVFEHAPAGVKIPPKHGH